MHSPRRLPRRRFLAGAAGAAGAAAALALESAAALARAAGRAVDQPGPRPRPRPVNSAVNNPALDGKLTHFAWVWQFRHDGAGEAIRDALAAHGLGIVLKTHDGTNWMSRFDTSPDAVSGPNKISELAAFFEAGGVPFHAWYNAHGVDPLTEAQMTSDILDAGARSMFIDLEPHQGFWRGTADTANQLGEELRRLQPAAWLSTSIDPRPWEIGNIPLAEFASFTNEIAPRSTGATSATPPTSTASAAKATTPARWVSRASPRASCSPPPWRSSASSASPSTPSATAPSSPTTAWTEFLEASFALDASAVSVWRFGNVEPGILQLLKDTPPRVTSYTVQAGDTLGALAAQWDVGVDELAAANGIANPNLIAVGQRLVIPHRGVGRGATPAAPAAPAPAASAAAGGSYTVQPGDAVWTLARRWDTTVEAIALANGLSDPTLIRIGDHARHPLASDPPRHRARRARRMCVSNDCPLATPQRCDGRR